MKRLNDDEIILTQDELNNIYEYIRNSLHNKWDRHTDHFICEDPWEQGMRRMDPEMYDFAEQIITI